ncbi:MAG: prolipoprotein diacylglyceryl transferase [Myxococcales bacterium]|nr:prolipoprotein diacylglyceryl transferase [Myxococcales bacterium]
MFPFVSIDESKLGPIHAYGLCLALALLSWDWLVMKRAAQFGLEKRDFRALTLWILVLGGLFGVGIDWLFYRPDVVAQAKPAFVLQGISITGGFVGAVTGGFVWRYLKITREGLRLRFERRAEPVALMPYSEVIVSTWPIAFTFGRLGCALVHDHPGVFATPGSLGAKLAVAWPLHAGDGVTYSFGPLHATYGSLLRYDLGLLECLYLAIITVAFAVTYKRRLRPWTYTAAGCLLYGGARFFLDFLRPGPSVSGGEPRHLGLTFAQWWSIAVVVAGLVFARRAWRSTGSPIPDRSPAAASEPA